MAIRQAERIIDVLRAARSQKNVVALLMPRTFAIGLIDELFPIPVAKESFGVERLDSIYKYEQIKAEKERERYLKAITRGGFVGTMLEIPMLVARNCVICALDEEELQEYSEMYQIDLGELVKLKANAG